MSDGAALSSLVNFAPVPFDRPAGARALDDIGRDVSAPELVSGVAGCSPYLARLMTRDPERLRLILASSPHENFMRAVRSAWRAAEEGEQAAQMKALRLAKSDAALAIALAEISGASSTMDAAAALSAFADASVGAALRMALRQAGRLGFRAPDPERPEENSGVTVLAMGKHGAHELNYSSDIDLVVLFDSAAEPLGGAQEAKRIAVAATRAMVSRLNDQTADGYVFRTDLRLRPDPGVSAAAVSINAAETYYESYGQNWERAAFIKARAAAGDAALGDEFIRRLRPFIWRKFLDFAAIEEIYAVMRQIHASKGAGEAEFYGHDLKRGLGGIREIEFFAQAQQLIGGGKNQAFRTRATLDALKSLSAAGLFTEETRAALDERYCYLRKVEHRLQMIADEQTHRIPAQEADAARIAVFLGEENLDAFRSRLLGVFRSTHELTAPLFRPEERQAPQIGPLNFTGVDNDPETIATLRRLGFSRPEQAVDAFRRWHAGETRATRSAKSRAVLAKVTPQLIEALSRANAPDEAFAAFDGFLRGLPAGVQIFSLFLNRPDVFERLIRIIAVSPFLAREVARRAYLAEALIESRWPDHEPTRDSLAEKLKIRLGAADGYEMALSAARRFASEESFAVSAQLLIGLITPLSAAARFTLIAEASLAALLDVARAEAERHYGRIEGELAVIALGRLGAGAMTAASDVDLMFIYRAGEDAVADGAARLDAVTYFGRLVRRYVSAITTLTEEGALYEVDMQLRPSGSKGPAAVSLSAFEKYYAGEAWTWELMALTKARVIAGDAGLGADIEREIARILSCPRKAQSVAADVRDMRGRLSAAKPAIGAWDLKHAVGGFVEMDFTVQYLLLTHAAAIEKIEKRDTASMTSALAAIGAIDSSKAGVLAEAYLAFETLQQISRAATGGVFAPGAAGDELRRLVASIFDADTIEEAQARLADMQYRVREIYEKIVLSEFQDGAK
jgi:glutamate-ammonia-ligase adenylyltransferase